MSRPYRLSVGEGPIFSFHEVRRATLTEAREEARRLCLQYPRYRVHIQHDDGRQEVWHAVPTCSHSQLCDWDEGGSL